MMRFANILVLLKMMLCAGCASIFDRVFPKLRPVFVIILSVSYAFADIRCCLSKHGLAGHDVSVPSFSAVAAAFGKNRIPGAVCIFSGSNDRCQFYLGYMLVLFLILAAGIWILFFRRWATRGKGQFSWLPGLWGAALLSAVIWIPALLQC